MRLHAVLLAAIALVACSRGFSSETDETDRAPAAPPRSHALPPGHPVHAVGQSPTHEGEPRRPHDVPAAGPSTPTAGGLTWTADAPFEPTTPDTPMRAAQYVFHGEGGAGDATLAVFHFPGMGGSIDDNVDRWLGQMTGPDGRPLTREGHVVEHTVNELPVSIVDAVGTMASGMPGMEQGPPAPGQRIVGAIVTGPNGLVFFKLTGPEATVTHAKPAFDALVATIHPL